MRGVAGTGHSLARISRARTLIRRLMRKVSNSLPASRGGMKKSLSHMAETQAETLRSIQNLERTFISFASDRMRKPALTDNAFSVAQQEVRNVLRLISPDALVDYTKVRVGDAGDGGYIQAEDLAGVAHAFSFGIDTNDSGHVQMTRLGVPVEQFDYSIEHPPSTGPLLRFNKLVVSREAGGGKITVPELLKHYADEFEYAAVDVHAAAEALAMKKQAHQNLQIA